MGAYRPFEVWTAGTFAKRENGSSAPGSQPAHSQNKCLIRKRSRLACPLNVQESPPSAPFICVAPFKEIHSPCFWHLLCLLPKDRLIFELTQLRQFPGWPKAFSQFFSVPSSFLRWLHADDRIFGGAWGSCVRAWVGTSTCQSLHPPGGLSAAPGSHRSAYQPLPWIFTEDHGNA